MKTSSLVEHIENHLGTIDQGWSLQKPSNSIQVVRFNNSPVVKASTYVTVGLSHHILQMPQGRQVRQELVFTAYDRFRAEEIASFLLTFSGYIAMRHKALLRGQVIGPTEPIISSTTMRAIYAAIPVLFSDSFATYDGSSPPTVFVWLFPLYSLEVSYVQHNGWSKFEDLLEGENPDLLDLNRQPVV